MTQFKAVAGASFLCTICICMFGLANASATSVYKCEEVSSGGQFIDNHCIASIGEQKFGTVKIGESTNIVMAGQEAGQLITGTIGVVPVKVRCTSLSGTGAVENFVNEKKENEAKGTGINVKFSGCTVEEPKKECVIKGGKFETTTLTALTSMQSETVTQWSLAPAAGNPIAEIQVEGCSLAALNGTYKLGGTAVGSVDSEIRSKTNFTKAGTEAGGLTLAGGKAGWQGSAASSVNTGGGVPGGTVSVENP